MAEHTDTGILDILDSYRDRLSAYREKLGWVRDYL